MANNNDDWYKFDYGKAFSKNDIERAKKEGFTDNQILKIGASAPYVKNSANKEFAAYNQRLVNPTSWNGVQMTGSAGLVASYLNSKIQDQQGNKDPVKAFTWNGLNANGTANALTINKPSGSFYNQPYTSTQKSGEPYGQWTTPMKILGGPDKTASGPMNPASQPETPKPPGFIPNQGPPEGPLLPAPEQKFGMSGTDTAINDSVTSFRRKKSKARTLGLTSKGTSQFKIGGQSSRSSGVNLGIG